MRSINIELPRSTDLERLAPEKNVERIKAAMGDIRARIDAAEDERKKFRAAPSFAAAGQIARSEFLREPVGEAEWLARPPKAENLARLSEAAKGCRACPLWKRATCAVFEEGPERARVVLVGEQPGDMENRAGRPFVGPAGQLLDRALAAAGVDRSGVYVTNAVKHFKFEPRGKRRIHKTANSREIAACRPWLAAELGLIQSQLIVALGATAARSLMDAPLKVTE